MAGTNNKLKTAKEVAGVVSTAAGAAGTISVVVKPFADAISDRRKERDELIEIPNLCDKKFPITLEDAVKLLTDMGLRAMPYQLRITDANIKYRNCMEFQIVNTKPKPRHKVQPGSVVNLSYIPLSVIEESQRLFKESEKRKAELTAQRKAKRAEHRAQLSEFVDSRRSKGKKEPSAKE